MIQSHAAMYKKLLSWLLVFSLATFTALSTHGQDVVRAPGVIKVAKATGTVTATKDGNTITLQTGSEISQGYVVNTGPDSSAVLAFSNGATINLAQNSSLSIDEFLQDPFADEISLANMTAEPSVSITKLNLSRGELVGNVKKLNADAGSSFTVQTPVGAAGIRGTTFRIVFRPDGTGKAFFALTTAEGNILLTSGTVNMPSSIAVPDNREVAVEIDVQVDSATGVITVMAGPSAPVVATIPPPATLAQVATAVQQTVQAVADVVFAPSGAMTNADGSGDAVTTHTPPPAPPATATPPKTTPGDGR